MSTPDLDEQRHSPEVERLKGEDVVPSSLSPTLSVGNIKHQATEDEISSVFSRLMRERGRERREREREREREGGGGGEREYPSSILPLQC